MISINTCFSQHVPVFHGKNIPENGCIVGYAAIIHVLELTMPMPNIWAIIASKHTSYETDEWKVLTPRHQPKESLYHHLVFSLKYEGTNLLFYKKLFEKLPQAEIVKLLSIEATGRYTRKIWFLYEWLMREELPIASMTIKNYVPLIDEKIQYALPTGIKSSRHRIINNLPGTVNFCPLVRKTPKLEQYIAQNLLEKQNTYLNTINKGILQRASAFLLLKDSKASFSIEGENPKSSRAARWGKAIGQAGTNELNKDELERLQQVVIENSRFVEMGFRKKGGFVGEHDRVTGEPIPDHISAKWQDLPSLLNGLIETNKLLINSEIDPIISATIIAFGFVFIHPFEDGNGRIHRYLIHHLLAKKNFSQQGIIFPISASVLDHIEDYKQVLEAYSLPILDLIDWEETKDHNVTVLNETIDYYRYYDATKQAEFLYDCVFDTIENIIPRELTYLIHYDEFKRAIDAEFEMPDRLLALLVNFLSQNNGVLSKRATEKEFSELSQKEVETIERLYSEIFKQT